MSNPLHVMFLAGNRVATSVLFFGKCMPKGLRPGVNDRTFVCDADAKCWMEMFNLDQTSMALCNFSLNIFRLKSNNKYHQASHECNGFTRIL